MLARFATPQEGVWGQVATRRPGPDVQGPEAVRAHYETAKREAALKEASTRYAKRPDILEQLSKAASAEPMR